MTGHYSGSPDRRIAGSPDRRIAGSPDRRIAQLCVRVTAMSLFAWLRSLCLPSSPSDPSSSGGCRDDARRAASSSDSFGSAFPQRGIAACAGFATRRFVPVLASALLALPLLAGLTTGAQAQTTTLVSNVGQTDSDSTADFNRDRAQAFTTGAAVSTLYSVEVEFDSISSSFTAVLWNGLNVGIYNDSGGRPATSVGTLTKPAFTTFSSARTLTFTSSAGISLAALTTYWLVFDVPGTGASLQLTSSPNEDSDGLRDWMIGDSSYWKSPSGDIWFIRSSASMKIRVLGEVVVPPPPTLFAISIAKTTATLNLRNSPETWYYKRTEPSAGACSAGQSGPTAPLTTGLTAGTVYTYAAYSDATCTTELASARFTTLGSLAASDITETTATLTLTDFTGTWYYQKIWPTPVGACLGPQSAGTAASLTGLTTSTDYYVYAAFSDATCSTKLASTGFSAVPTVSFSSAFVTVVEDEGYVDIELTLSQRVQHNTRINFSYDNLSSASNLDYGRRPWLVVRPSDGTNPVLRLQIVNDKSAEDTEVFRITMEDGPGYTRTLNPLTNPPSPPKTDVIITDPDYWTVESPGGYFSCFGKRALGPDEDYPSLYPSTRIADPDNPGEYLETHPRGTQVYPRPNLNISWDKTSYLAGETAKITIRTRDGRRSCAPVFMQLFVASQTAEEMASNVTRYTFSSGTPDHPLRGGGGAVLSAGLRPGERERVIELPLQADGRIRFSLNGAGSPVYLQGSSTSVSTYPVRTAWLPVSLPVGLSFARSSLEVRESTAGTVDLVVNISPPPTAPFDLSFNVEGTATPGADYTIPGLTGANGIVTAPAGASRVSIPVTIVDDSDEDSGETIILNLQNSGGLAVAQPGRMTVTILNHDPVDPNALTPGAPSATGIALPGTVAAPLSSGVVTVMRPSGWTGSGKVQFGGGSKARDKSDFTTLRIENVSDDSFEVTWASRTAGRRELTLEWQPVAGASWQPSDGGPKDPRVLTIEDPNPDEPEITVTAGDAVTEGGSASFTITASPAPTSPLAVNVTVATDGDWSITAGAQTVSIPTTGSYTLTLTTTDDGTDEPDGSVTATVEDGDGYTVGSSASATIAIRDDDLPPPMVTLAAKTASVTEGGHAEFTLTADRAPDADLTVTLSVSETGDHVAATDEGAATAIITKGETEAVFTLATVNDDLDEPDSSVTATVQDSEGYTVGDPASATVTVQDDDTQAPSALTVADVTAREGVDWLMTFTVRLSTPSTQAVEVRVDTRPSNPVSAQPQRDYWPLVGTVVRFRPGETEKPVQVLVYDDSHDEEAETFELALSDAKGASIEDGVAVGTIVNDDPMPAAFLSRFGRTVAQQALDGIAGRMTAPRATGLQGSIAGWALGADSAGAATDNLPLSVADLSDNGFSDNGLDSHDSDTQSQTMSATDILLGSNFTATGETDGNGGSMAFWGRAAQGNFDGREGTFSLDGEATTAMLGADYARGKWLVGLALTQSEGEGDYRDTRVAPRPDDQTCPANTELCRNAVRAGDGKIESSLTAWIPYSALQVSERLKLWGAAGHGSGEVTLKTELGGNYPADTTWNMAAAGMRGELLEAPAQGSGLTLAVTSDALWTRTTSRKTRDLAASDSDSTRLRIGLEGGYPIALKNSGTLTPTLALGARHDGGDAETGFGVEIGGGVKWTDPALGLNLDLSGRTLVAHDNDDLKDRGFAVSLLFDPDPASERGLSLSLRQDWGGQAEGGIDALFASDPLEDRTGSVAQSRWQAEAAYGLPAFGGRFTGAPHAGVGLATDTRDYSIGWRLRTAVSANAPGLSFGLKATRHESDTAQPEYRAGFEFTLRW